MSKRLTYLPKLDSLRAIAALMVLFSHYLVEVHGPGFRYGGYGVQIFFVISGYLITSILLSQKHESDSTKPKLIGNFIIKRALRLFPVYFLFLTVLVVISRIWGLWLTAEGTLWHYYTYTQNFLFFEQGFQSTLLNHTWSLAVEEQFYLLWPFIILLIPRKAELAVLVSVFITGIISRIYFIDFLYTPGTVKGITLIHFDTLGAGALLAWTAYYDKKRVLDFFDRFSDFIFAGTFGLSLWLSMTGADDSFFLPLLVTLMSLSLVFISTYKKRSFLDPLLNIGVLRRIGKISYGVYLFHKPVPFFFDYTWKKAGLSPIDNGVILFVIYFVITMLIASLSWKLFEKPILRLKEKFDI